jgi:hypothetical protein
MKQLQAVTRCTNGCGGFGWYLYTTNCTGGSCKDWADGCLACSFSLSTRQNFKNGSIFF